MEQIQVVTGSGQYPVYIGSGAREVLVDLISTIKPSRVVVITDSNVGPLWIEQLRSVLKLELPCIELGFGEDSKSIPELEKSWDFLFKEKIDRHSLVLNLGGGLIGDLGGFAAATYMRGVKFIQIPTTLLSQVDASVGGKLAINFRGIKNLIGSFQQPQAVICDTELLKTLASRELRSGYAEVLKHGFIRSSEYLESVAKLDPCDLTAEDFEKVVSGSVKIKSEVVGIDEHEMGLRKILNFGHTMGHALESLSHETEHALLHGEAIALGMVFEARLSKAAGQLKQAEVEQLEQVIGASGLPIRPETKPTWNNVLQKLKKDKKNKSNNINWTLLNSLGVAAFDCAVDDELAKTVYDSWL